MKVVFSHDWLNGMRGGEKCLEAMIEKFPDSEICTILYDRKKLSKTIAGQKITASWVQKKEWLKQRYKSLLLFLPHAIEGIKVPKCDVIVSMNHCVAKGIKKPNQAIPHLCYCFTPMRYAWLFFDEYFGHYPKWFKPILKVLLSFMRRWDLKRSKDVDHFIGISKHIAKRIKACYGRDADVIYPPVDTEFYTPEGSLKEDFYLIVSALVPYKKVDLAVQAFTELNKKLVVIGSGPEEKRLKTIAGNTIEFKGWQSNEVIRDYYRRAKGLIFPGEEDFGIVPVEAQACGTPVLAFKKGGALETVENGKTGLFFDKQTKEQLMQCVLESDRTNWSVSVNRKNAERFSKEEFQEQLSKSIEKIVISSRPVESAA